jgi:hypothetical protein
MFLPSISILLFIASTAAFGTELMREPGAMLREGTWIDDVGAYSVPQAFEKIKPANWPVDRWHRLTLGSDHISSEPVIAPPGQMPTFLRSIVTQLETRATGSTTSQSLSPVEAPEWVDQLYLRVPGSRFLEGSIQAYVFKNGTSTLRPKLDYRYELQLGGLSFAFTVRNGLRGKNGEAYGSGAQYTVEYDGHEYEYSLGEFGWDSTIRAIADLDGDGKPDFIVTVGGNNSGYEAVLLSSKAKPGTNPATASLFQIGC